MTERDLDIAIEKCERIMEIDTRTMQNPVSENGHIFEKVYELLKFLRQLQFATDTNVATTDTISREAAVEAMRKAKDKSEAHRMLVQLPPAQLAQDLPKGCTDTISRAAVVDVIEGVDWYHQNKSGEMVHGANDDEHQAWYKADDIYKAIESVPSAQPDVPDTNVGELISRQAAIKALEETKQSDPFNRYEYQNIGIDWSIDVIKALPSAQPGWIPCSERLPGKDESFYVLCCDKYGEIMIGNVFECYDGETPYSAESENGYMYDCVAWMPLPTSYREGGQ